MNGNWKCASRTGPGATLPDIRARALDGIAACKRAQQVFEKQCRHPWCIESADHFGSPVVEIEVNLAGRDGPLVDCYCSSNPAAVGALSHIATRSLFEAAIINVYVCWRTAQLAARAYCLRTKDAIDEWDAVDRMHDRAHIERRCGRELSIMVCARAK